MRFDSEVAVLGVWTGIFILGHVRRIERIHSLRMKLARSFGGGCQVVGSLSMHLWLWIPQLLLVIWPIVLVCKLSMVLDIADRLLNVLKVLIIFLSLGFETSLE